MLPDQAALYRGILANPPADLPRLVYADWLDDHGRGERAEFIRVQCALANATPADDDYCDLVEREIELKAILEDELRAERSQHTEGHTWQHRRGMPDTGGPPHGLAPTASQVPQLDDWRERITELRAIGSDHEMATVIAGGPLPALSHIRLSGILSPILAQRLNDASWAPKLVSLSVQNGDRPAEWPETGSVLSRPLRELRLDSDCGSNAAFAHLLRSPGLRTLRRFGLDVPAAGVSRLTVLGELLRDGAVEVPELRHLTLKVYTAHRHSLLLLAQAPIWETVSSFTFECNFGVEQGDWAEFFRLWNPKALRHLSIRATAFQNKGGRAFAANRSLAGLRVLELSPGKLSATAFRAILAASQLQNLLALKLSHTGAKKEYEALADPAVFPHARRIELREHNLPPTIADKLRTRDGLELRDF